MAKKATPWYWEARDGWYVNVGGRRHSLGEHQPGAARPEKSKKTGRWNSPPQIDEAFRRLLAGAAPRAPARGDAVIAVFDNFLAWCHENRGALTTSRYQDFIQDFVAASPEEGGLKYGELPAGRLTSRHVSDWLGRRPSWGPTTRKNAITALQAGFNWAVQNRGLDRNPIRGMKKPQAKRRSDVVSPAEFEEMLALVGDGCFRDLLVVSYDSGARPIEIKELERRHFQPDKHRAVIPAEEAKGRKQPRTIYFATDRSLDIVRRLCAERPEGAVFRNARGNKWTGDAVKCRFEDLQTEFGLAEMKRQGVELDLTDEAILEAAGALKQTRVEKQTGRAVRKTPSELRKEARRKLTAARAAQYARRFNHYAFRRTFITRKIIAGVDSHVVAKLSGHQSTAMVDRHYSAVANDHEFMLREAQKEIGPIKDASK